MASVFYDMELRDVQCKSLHHNTLFLFPILWLAL